MTRTFTLSFVGVALLLAAVPVIVALTDNTFYLSVATRALILAAAATSLNLIMGYGGLISLGHALFVGIGGYVVGVCSYHAFADGAMWMSSGFLQVVTVLVLSGVVGLLVGLMSLRTRGVYFLMITLAIGQMFYLAAVGAYAYGGDDGMTIFVKSDFAGFKLSGRDTVYWVSAAYLLASILVVARLSQSRFGLVLQAARTNEQRARSMGYDPVRVRLVAFVVSGVMAGFAGFLLANHTGFISPAMMHWTRSGDLIVMVIVGGLGSVFGPLIGTVVFLVLEEVFSGLTEYWAIPLGIFLVLVSRFASQGIAGLLRGRPRND